ncbi:MAG: N-acetylmuramoyl-L-alanine amidase [Actinomycetota bacterium]
MARPPIVQKPIPFGRIRQKEMVAYGKRHYGLGTWHLEHPHVIVEHYTAGTSFESAYNTFAANSPDLGELPGTCAHFIVDTDGTIYQVAPLNVMCRHTVGLNYTAIGIEDVGTSDQQVLRNKVQRDASLRLTLWLMQHYGISLPNVIGHNESLSSPYHHELVASWRCQTHSDWTHPDMETYRRLLADLATREGVRISHRASGGRSDATSC